MMSHPFSGESPQENGKPYEGIETDDRSEDFWEQALEEAKQTFERGIESIRASQELAIDLIKVNLILASIYVAVFNSQLIPLSSLDILPVITPFILLLFSSMAFLLIYYKLGGHTIGPSHDNLRSATERDIGRKEYVRIMSDVYFRWSDENIHLHQESVRYVSMGISLDAMSMGVFVSIIMFS
jgi:hypothetical protein